MSKYTTDAASCQEGLTLTPAYISAVNSITQPGKYVFCSRYLVEKWLPDLGANAFAILCFLRRECYHNRQTDELRNELGRIAMPDIARGCQMSVSTVRRELKTNKYLQRFVSVRREYTPDLKKGGVRYDKNSYTVLMDDPVHASDDALLQERVKLMAEVREKAAADPKERAKQQGLAAMRQNEPTQDGHDDELYLKRAAPPVKMIAPPTRLIDPPLILGGSPYQNDASLIEYPSILKDKLEDTSLTPPAPKIGGAAFGAVSLSLSTEKEPKEPEQKAIVIPPLFPGQTEAEREAFGAAYRRARKELAKPAFMAKHKRQSGPMDWYQRAVEIQAEDAAAAEAASLTAEAAKGETL